MSLPSFEPPSLAQVFQQNKPGSPEILATIFERSNPCWRDRYIARAWETRARLAVAGLQMLSHAETPDWKAVQSVAKEYLEEIGSLPEGDAL